MDKMDVVNREHAGFEYHIMRCWIAQRGQANLLIQHDSVTGDLGVLASRTHRPVAWALLSARRDCMGRLGLRSAWISRGPAVVERWCLTGI
jgi:hypothetical protein